MTIYDACKVRSNQASTTEIRSGLTWAEVVVAIICVVILVNLLLPVGGSRAPSKRTICRNNLKQILLALHNYHDSYGVFPPAYTTDSDGKPLHSWRALILPMIDQWELYQSIDFSKPWDDPVNETAFRTAPVVYRCPSFRGKPELTTYLAIVSATSCFRPGQSCSLSEITDDHSSTIIIVEGLDEHAVPWMSPNDSDENAMLKIGKDSTTVHAGGFHVGLADDSVRFINADLPAENRRALMTVSGGENLEF